MCSDHFHPWSERQGHSGFAWSWLGSALEATSLSLGTVCAPGQRYHPAVIAQAAATLAEMYPGRFWLAVGSGEAVNESITGDEWPDKPARLHRLAASVDVMRRLWRGEAVTQLDGVRVHKARLYSRPLEAPLLVGAALTPATARWAASWADALITVAGPHESVRAVVEAFRDGGGAGKPVFLQATLSYASTDDEAARAAYDQWRQCALPTPMLADLASPAEFDRHAAEVRLADVLARVPASSSIQRHAEWLLSFAPLGFHRIYLHNVARDHHEAFLDACATHLLPARRD